MVKFLIHRPIAVIMSFLALMFLGVITVSRIPVSLMPDIDIPEITVQISKTNTPARELENSVVKSIRMQLIQVGHLKDIESETRDGYALIHMKFVHGTDINFAYIECNEKIDDAMNGLPRDVDRPRVIKASASDIPVFNLMVTRKAGWSDEERFLELSEFVRSVIMKRIEQLPQVAMVDISGYTQPQLEIRPDYTKLGSLGITDSEILNAVEQNNLTVGNLMVREGYYQYHINFANYLKNEDDVGNIFISKGDRLFQLKELADIQVIPQDRKGLFFNRHKAGLCLSIIKQSDARMADLKEELDQLLAFYQTNYSDLDFEIEKDQTQILSFSIRNLKQSLLLGAGLAIFIMFFFLKDFRSPILIGFSIPVSLIICFLFFYLFKISINIISLSGLVLAVGMMIDNSIIVIDNINQYRATDSDLDQSCIQGTNEVIRPLISSALTTCAVFIPLIFLSGISGALFFDQAIAVTIGLGVSFLVSITLLPMLFRLFYQKQPEARNHPWLEKVNRINYEKAYDRSFDHIFNHRWIYLGLFVLILASIIFMGRVIEVKSFPQMEQTEVVAVLDWNEAIHVNENSERITGMITSLSDSLIQYSILAGEQQFILSQESNQTASEAEIYFRSTDPNAIDRITGQLTSYLSLHFPLAHIKFHPPENIFEVIFSEDMPPFLTRLSDAAGREAPSLIRVNQFTQSMDSTDGIDFLPIPVQDQIVISVDPERLVLYKLNFRDIELKLQSSFNQHRIGMLKSYQQYIPIMLGDEKRTVVDIINETMVVNRNGEKIPLSSLVKLGRQQQLKTIRAVRNGEYIPLEKTDPGKQIPELMKKIKEGARQFTDLQVDFDGTWFRQKEIMNELLIVLLISLLLLYFILAAQFESFIQPLIVLIELPIDIAGALVMLLLFKGSLNIMSAIGIIVMSGIIINDSILKIDTINRTRRSGVPLLEAIHVGGRRRLKPIIMTSLTTILALIPFLFFKGLGAELQRPLALAVIGGMTIGTLVSLYFIPLAYWVIYRKR